MEIKLSEYYSNRIVYKRVYDSEFEQDAIIHKGEGSISEPAYSIRIQEKWFEGICVATLDASVNDEERLVFHSSKDHISYLFDIEGNTDFVREHQSAQVLNNVVIHLKKPSVLICIQLTTSYYAQLTGEIAEADIVAVPNESVSAELRALLNQVINYGHKGMAERVYLEAKILELMVWYNVNKISKVNGIKQDDIRKILSARQIVEDNLQKPYSLIELSRKAGINDFKLKKGFKALTGFTVFGYLFKLRMEKAYYYLQQERKQVNEVSFLVGYKNPQHFIAAFKKHYSLLPGSLNKS